jgi:hypothetical protein
MGPVQKYPLDAVIGVGKIDPRQTECGIAGSKQDGPAVRMIGWLVDGALLSGSVLTLGSAVVLGWLHLHDRYGVDFVDGVHMAVARYVNLGTLYPPFENNGLYGGSRYMPLPIVLGAIVASGTGEYLVSTKVLAYGAVVALMLTTFLVVRSLRCPVPLALSLAVMPLLTQAGLKVGTSKYADALPALLQVLAVWSAQSRQRLGTVGAGVLAALALTAKINAIWAVMAIGVYFLFVRRDLARLGLFTAVYVVSAAALLAIFAVSSDGRLFPNIFAGFELLQRGALETVYIVFLLGTKHIGPVWYLLPLVALAAMYSMVNRSDNIWLIALACATGVLSLVFTDIGADWNHLIDFVVLVTIVIGSLASDRLGWAQERHLLAVVAITVLWVQLTALATYVLPEVRSAITAARAPLGHDLDPQPLRGLATTKTHLLAEDPYIALTLQQVPVVLDPHMFRLIARRNPETAQSLVRRIGACEFELIVLLRRLDDAYSETWYERYHFGLDVISAIRHRYRYRETRGPYYVYERTASAGECRISTSPSDFASSKQ